MKFDISESTVRYELEHILSPEFLVSLVLNDEGLPRFINKAIRDANNRGFVEGYEAGLNDGICKVEHD